MRLLQEAHKILLSGVRGEHKQPGEVRTAQNWIGGTSIQTAAFIPPHPEDMGEALKDLEFFWHNKGLNMPHLIKMAISHYRFETIHPFNDGNGRMAVYSSGFISSSLEFYENRRCIFRTSLKETEAHIMTRLLLCERTDLDQWIVFFLSAVIETAKRQRYIRKIIDLRARYEKQIMELGRRAKLAHKLYCSHFPCLPLKFLMHQNILTRFKHSDQHPRRRDGARVSIIKEITGFLVTGFCPA